MMNTTKAGGVVATYLLLRRAIGWIGLLLPIVVMVLVMLLFLVGTAIVTSAIALRRARYRALRADTL